MATIKLGGLTLSNVSIGGSTIGDVRKLTASKMFRTQALKNHAIGKRISGINEVVITPPIDTPSDWLLANGTWNDNGVWDDTQTWTE